MGGRGGMGWSASLIWQVRAHARSLGCSSILGYHESTSYRGEIVILSGLGTAAVLALPQACHT